MAADRRPVQVGQRFAGCIVERRLGAGATSVVHAAFDEAAEAWRALKVFDPQGPGEAEARTRFLREAALAARMQHPGVARVYRSGVDGGRPWLLMELLPGVDLGRYTRAARLLPAPVVLGLGERIAQALAQLHAAGIVHRDLKPANVMVDWAGDRVALTDFGLSRSADAEATRTGLVLGSPAYMAPELLAGAVPDPRSDLYALGVLLFELLAGRLPFQSSGLGELLREVASEPAPDLEPLHPGLGREAAAAVAALLAKSPAARPASAADAASALGALAAQAATATATAAAAAGVPGHGPMSRR